MTQDPRRRPRFWQRKYLINLHFQLKYISYVVGISTVISGLLCYFIYRGTLENTELMEIKEMQLGTMIAAEDNKILLLLLVFIVLQGLCTLGFALMLTHRIAGPLFRVELFLKALSEGRLLSVRSFRKSDEFKSLADMMKAVSGRLGDLQRKDLDVLDAVAKQVPADETGEKLREALEVYRRDKTGHWHIEG